MPIDFSKVLGKKTIAEVTQTPIQKEIEEYKLRRMVSSEVHDPLKKCSEWHSSKNGMQCSRRPVYAKEHPEKGNIGHLCEHHYSLLVATPEGQKYKVG